jgi:hypothetical protein
VGLIDLGHELDGGICRFYLNLGHECADQGRPEESRWAYLLAEKYAPDEACRAYVNAVLKALEGME